MGKTITEKILAKAAGRAEVSPGDFMENISANSPVTAGGGGNDDLDTIDGGSVAGEILIIRSVNSGHDVRVRDVSSSGIGNIKLSLGNDFDLDDVDDTLVLMFDGSYWLELSRSDNT